MTNEEANKIIAEYMDKLPIVITERVGIKITQRLEFFSLDALVPVWERIHNKTLWNIEMMSDTMNAFEIEWHHFGVTKVKHEGELNETIQEAAAIATAKAILKLK